MEISILNSKFNIKPIALFVLIVILLPLLYVSLPSGLDWVRDYRPAALAMLRGDSPYARIGFYNPPWTLLPLMPLALLPERVGRILLFVFSLGAFVAILAKLRAKPIAWVLFLSSSSVIGCLWNGNIDPFIYLSVFLPAPFGLLLAVIKPQVGLGLVFFWSVKVWREEGLAFLLLNFFPLAILATASYMLYGLPVSHYEYIADSYWNVSLFPYLIPIGIFLLWESVRRKSGPIAAAASPFFAPYHTGFSLITFLALLLDRPKLLFLAWVLLWVPTLVEAFL